MESFADGVGQVTSDGGVKQRSLEHSQSGALHSGRGNGLYGEVTCFGVDMQEAFLYALLATNFT
eukprot:gene42695-52965_t